LNTSERSLVSSAYKNIVGNKRAELRVLNAIIAKDQKYESES
jgi:14-3-3 protein epsilon